MWCVVLSYRGLLATNAAAVRENDVVAAAFARAQWMLQAAARISMYILSTVLCFTNAVSPHVS